MTKKWTQIIPAKRLEKYIENVLRESLQNFQGQYADING